MQLKSKRLDGWRLKIGLMGLSLLIGPASSSAQTQVRTGSASGQGSMSGGSFSGGSFSGGSFSGGSFSGGSASGGSFSGGSFSGGSMSGGSFSGGSFSGGSFSGGSLTGSSGRPGSTGYGMTGSSSQGVSQTNPFYNSFANPMVRGMPGGNANTRFGMPLYNITTTGSSGSITGNVGGFSGQASATFNAATGAHRTTPFVAGSDFPVIPPPPVFTKAQRDVQGVLARSTALPSKDNIRVAMEGSTVVLRGTVNDDRERLLSEAMIRMTPGVNEVRNELKVKSNGTGLAFPP